VELQEYLKTDDLEKEILRQAKTNNQGWNNI
jgi:hypothetical protein